MRELQMLREEYELPDPTTTQKKTTWKYLVKKEIKIKADKWMKEATENMTKLAEWKKHKKSIEREEYLASLHWQEAQTILKARTGMTKIKTNYKNKVTDTKCEMCKEEEDTLQHMIETCQTTRPFNRTNMKYMDLFTKTSERQCMDNLAIFIKTQEDQRTL